MLLEEDKIEKVAFILKTIGHPVRIRIVELLTMHGKLSVNEICELVKVEQSLVSHHLNNMKLKGILDSKREGKNIYYFLELQEVTKVIECMSTCKVL